MDLLFKGMKLSRKKNELQRKLGERQFDEKELQEFFAQDVGLFLEKNGNMSAYWRYIALVSKKHP